ncbi:hypothetical protein Q1695_004191 [Nippostrongylus brasiliensis]|nr:hypothetical protein Q1695_004191 [Nippostrongylus brasiliensis]
MQTQRLQKRLTSTRFQLIADHQLRRKTKFGENQTESHRWWSRWEKLMLLLADWVVSRLAVSRGSLRRTKPRKCWRRNALEKTPTHVFGGAPRRWWAHRRHRCIALRACQQQPQPVRWTLRLVTMLSERRHIVKKSAGVERHGAVRVDDTSGPIHSIREGRYGPVYST